MASLFKIFRRRFGISAPRMTVITHVSWYWRWLGMILVGAATLALAAWMYDAGRRFAGFDRSEAEEELDRLRASVAAMKEETSRLRASVDASGSRMKIEQAAQGQLAKQVKSLETENARLKEDLAFFENLLPSQEKLTIHRFTVDPEVLPGEFRYRLLVLQGGRRERAFLGKLQLVISVQRDGRDAMIILPEAGDADSSAYKLSFKHFLRVEGTFRVSSQAKVRNVQVRVIEDGSNQARAVQNVNLS